MRISRAVRSVLFAFAMLTLSAASFGQISISVNFGPPALPIYEQPLCPEEGYLWTPGYWAYADDDYYWVPGTWVQPPEAGLLWTPPYWGWDGDRFAFYDGYWGPQVGFYGGIAYGFGYFGEGYQGGRWDQGRFFYNQSVNNVNVTNIHNVYNETVVNNTTVNRVSYNGGDGGITAKPRPQDEAAAHERHVPPVAAQTQQVQAARSNPELKASANQGKPPIAATPKPGAFKDKQVVPAKQAGAPYNPAAKPASGQARNSGAAPSQGVHPKDMPPHPRPAAPDAGNSKQDPAYQQQEKLYTQQEKDHQKLQQRQDQEHQRMAQPQADSSRTQQLEQRHQQQTQEMEQKHAQEQKQLQERQRNRNEPPPSDEKKQPN